MMIRDYEELEGVLLPTAQLVVEPSTGPSGSSVEEDEDNGNDDTIAMATVCMVLPTIITMTTMNHHDNHNKSNMYP